MNVVVAVFECASAIFLAFFARGVWPCKYGDVHLVAAYAHLHRNLEIPQAGGKVVLGNDRCALVVENELFVAKDGRRSRYKLTVCPYFRDIAAFGDVGVPCYVNGAARLIEFDIGTVRDIERRIQGDVELVIGTFCVHLGFGRAETPHEFVFAIYGNIGIDRGCVEIDVSDVFIFAGHAGVIDIFGIVRGMGHPAPIARIFVYRFYGLGVGYPVPSVSRAAVQSLVLGRSIKRVVLPWGTDSSDEQDIDTEPAGTFDDGGAKGNGIVPLPRFAFGVVSVLDFYRAHMTEPFIEYGESGGVARFVESGLVVGLANVGTDGHVVVEVVVAAHVHAYGEAVKCSGFVVDDVYVDSRFLVPFVLECFHAEIVLRDRRREF